MTTRHVRRAIVAAAMTATAIAGAVPASAAACSPTSDTTDVSGYRTVVFTALATCTFDLGGTATVNLLVVGGGGAGASSTDNVLGGGGGGGVAMGSATFSGTVTITVGDGGAGVNLCQQASNGQDSVVTDGTVSVTAHGGGRGAGCNDSGDGLSGGSGGGAHPWNGAHFGGTATQGSVSGTTGVTLYGNAGASADSRLGGGGGGGAGAAAPTVTTTAGGAGGEGISSSITGTAVVYGSGGGGSGTTGGLGGTGAGNGGGPSTAATAGTDGTGGGGGAACVSASGNCSYAGGGKDGGSGIVVLKFTVSSDPTTLIATYLDAPHERASMNFLTKAASDMVAGKCNGSSTSFISVTLSLQKRGILSSEEATTLIAAARSLCP